MSAQCLDSAFSNIPSLKPKHSHIHTWFDF